MGGGLWPDLRRVGRGRRRSLLVAATYPHPTFSCPSGGLNMPGMSPIGPRCTTHQASLGWAGAALLAATAIWLIAWALATRGMPGQSRDQVLSGGG